MPANFDKYSYYLEIVISLFLLSTLPLLLAFTRMLSLGNQLTASVCLDPTYRCCSTTTSFVNPLLHSYAIKDSIPLVGVSIAVSFWIAIALLRSRTMALPAIPRAPAIKNLSLGLMSYIYFCLFSCLLHESLSFLRRLPARLLTICRSSSTTFLGLY